MTYPQYCQGPEPVFFVSAFRVPVIPSSARKLAQVQDNAASFDLLLSPRQLRVLDDSSHIDLCFLYELDAKDLPRAFSYGGLRYQILA